MGNKYKAINLSSWWTVKKYDTGASTWVTDSAIPAPGIDEITQDRVSTSQIISLTDGGIDRMSPETTYNYDPIRFMFHRSQVSTALIN